MDSRRRFFVVGFRFVPLLLLPCELVLEEFEGAGDCLGFGVVELRTGFFFFFEGGPLELSEEPTDEVTLGEGEGSCLLRFRLLSSSVCYRKEKKKNINHYTQIII